MGATGPPAAVRTLDERFRRACAAGANRQPRQQRAGQPRRLRRGGSQPGKTPSSLEKRVADLEKQLKSSADKEKKATAAAAQKFTARIFGRIHMDAASFSQNANSLAQVGNQQNGIDIRRARLGAEGEGFDIFFYRFDVDFASFDNQFSNKRPIIVDAYLDTNNLPYLGTVRTGHYREFFSLERLDSTNDLPFMERTLPVNTFFNLRNDAVGFVTPNQSKTMTLAMNLAADSSNNFGESLGDHNGEAFSTRMTWLPWYDEPSGGRYYLQFGGSYRAANVRNHLKTIQQTPDVQLHEDTALPATAPNQTTRFVSTGALSVNNYQCFGTEFVATLGSLSLQGEWLGCLENGYKTNFNHVFFNGYYVEALYFLTGENRNLDRDYAIHRRVQPNSNFFRVRTDNGICMGSGMWELAARVDNLNLNNGPVRGGDETNVTLGVNWYYSVRCRIMFNYIHAMLDKPALAAGGGPAPAGAPFIHGNTDILATRFQFAF